MASCQQQWILRSIKRQMDVLILADDSKVANPPNIQWQGPVETTYSSLPCCWEM